MRKVFVIAIMIGALMTPLTVSTAAAEEEHFFKKQSEGIQKWLETSKQTKEAMDGRHKAMHERQAASNEENKKIKERLVDYKMKSRKAMQRKKIPNQWYAINE